MSLKNASMVNLCHFALRSNILGLLWKACSHATDTLSHFANKLTCRVTLKELVVWEQEHRCYAQPDYPLS